MGAAAGLHRRLNLPLPTTLSALLRGFAASRSRPSRRARLFLLTLSARPYGALNARVWHPPPHRRWSLAVVAAVVELTLVVVQVGTLMHTLAGRPRAACLRGLKWLVT